MLTPFYNWDDLLCMEMLILPFPQIQITVNGAPIINVDIGASNGIIHVIDQVLFPIPDGCVYETLAKVDAFSTLLQFVQQAGLQDILTSEYSIQGRIRDFHLGVWGRKR